ncbi:MAG: hypothetical protein F6K35_06455, partial [Okeania sp. SIO2H7]|nr:hypothetical protein [Okeania sp. SIO2H7]
WRSLLPRFTNDQLAMIFLQFGASLWVLRTNQVGGYDPNIEAIVPTDFVFFAPRVDFSYQLSVISYQLSANPPSQEINFLAQSRSHLKDD